MVEFSGGLGGWGDVIYARTASVSQSKLGRFSEPAQPSRSRLSLTSGSRWADLGTLAGRGHLPLGEHESLHLRGGAEGEARRGTYLWAQCLKTWPRAWSASTLLRAGKGADGMLH